MRLAGFTILAMVAAGAGQAVAAGVVRHGARVEAGVEHDTNPGRVERIPNTYTSGATLPSPLGRTLVSGNMATPLAPGQMLSFSGSAAGRAFARASARDEDAFVTTAMGAWSAAWGRATTVGVGGAYYDVFQRRTVEARDFRSLAPALRVGRELWGGTLDVGAGYRWFSFKPNADLGFSGVTARVDFRRSMFADPLRGGADWVWSIGGSGERRVFSGRRCADLSSCPGAAGSGARVDRFATAHLDITRTEDFLIGAGAAVQVNDSNSYGESLMRGLGHVRAAALLPWQLSAVGRAELVFTRYRDSVPLARNPVTGLPLASIEDEGRSTVRVELTRAMGEVAEAGARYTLFTNELGAGPVEYSRQTFLLFVAWNYGNER